MLLTLILTLACRSSEEQGDKNNTTDTGSTNTIEDTGSTTTADSGDYGMGVPDYIPCDDTTTTIAEDDDSLMGFSGLDVLAQTATVTSSTARWSEGSSPNTTLHITVSSAGAPIFHDLEESTDTGGPSQGADFACMDYLEQPVTLDFYTDDGAFNESLSTAIYAMDIDAISVGGDFDPFALNGSFTFADLDPSEWDTVSLSLSNGWSNGGIQGQISMSASVELSGDSGTASGMGMIGPVLIWP